MGLGLYRLMPHFTFKMLKYKNLEYTLDQFFDLEINRSKINTLWSLGHNDGPGVGLVEYNKKIYLADNLDDIQIRGQRIFFLIDLGQERINKLLEWSENRKKIYGNYMQWNANGTHKSLCNEGNNIDKDLWRRNNIKPSHYPAKNDKVVGWFRGWKK